MSMSSDVGAGDARDAAASLNKFFRQSWAKFRPIWVNLRKISANLNKLGKILVKFV